MTIGGLTCVLTIAFSDAATVTGVVKFPGETPPRNMFANAADHDCPHGIPQTHLLVKQLNRGLQNALVILERTDRRVMPTRVKAQLNTEGCQLLPRVQWVTLGTSLSISNKDSAHHHLRALLGEYLRFVVDLAADTPPTRRPLIVPGLYKINCDHHLWERAWIYVSPHDSAAITDSQGTFVIKNVPPGRYQVRAWHEGWVEKGKDLQGRLEFQPVQDIRALKVQDAGENSVTLDNLTPTFTVPFP